jgi:serine/alanine adding enzyme
MSESFPEKKNSETEIKCIEESDFKKWREFVDAHPQASVMHRIEWYWIIRDTYGHQPLFLMLEEQGAVQGILPLFLVRGSLFGTVLASGIFGSHCSVCANTEHHQQALMKAAAALARDNNVSYLEVKNRQSVALDSTWHTKNDYCTMILDLSKGVEPVWDKWSPKLRQGIRKSQKANLRVERGPELLGHFYELVAVNMKRLGTPVHSKAFYQNILTNLGADADTFVVYLGDRPISSCITLVFQAQCEILLNASDPEFWNLKPNEYLYWEVLQRMAERGVTKVDFGRSPVNSGTYDFKIRLGADPFPLYYEYFLYRRRDVPQIDNNNRLLALATNCWKRVPLRITKLLGPHLIKQVV